MLLFQAIWSYRYTPRSMVTPSLQPLEPELISLVEWGRELRGLEYKTSMSWSESATQLKVARASLAMSNIEDGGSIVFGVEETSPGLFAPVGMTPTDYGSFIADRVHDFVNDFADQPIALDVIRGHIDSRSFVIIRVFPFREIPTICKSDAGAKSEMRAGALYTRSFNRAESVEVRSQTEMREIIDRAVDRSVQRLLSRTRGLISGSENIRETLDRELEGLI